ncbi:MAG: type II secretion system F family protein [Candidatus Aenigmarchaeota archaeon]|nr:type II secretion system F family protein [Candidatus Aenigmarchaeota archaeon]
MRRIYRVFGQFAPYKRSLKNILRYAGIEDISSLEFSGFMILYSSILAMISFLLGLFLFDFLTSVIIAISAFFGFQLFLYVILSLVVDSRARQIEEVLPDALQLMSANIRAGMTLDRALWLAARPEFGPLEEEIKRFGKNVFGGKSMIDSLKEMGTRVRSDILDRTIKLIQEGIESGGEMAHLLEETAADIRNIKAMKQEIKSNVMMYSMFIIFASVIGAPVLFAVSVYFIEVISGLWSAQTSQIGKTPYYQTGMIKMKGPQVSSGDMLLFSVSSIILTTVFGALIIGLIQSGKEKRGLKYIPFLTGGALLIFFGVRFVISSMFSSFLGF